MSACVLVVENDPLFAEAVSANLAAAGYRVAGPVDSALAALAACEVERPDAAIVDIGLSGDLDGVFLGGELAERGIAVVYLTALVDRAAREARGHAAAVLAKPCGYGELTAALDRALAGV